MAKKAPKKKESDNPPAAKEEAAPKAKAEKKSPPAKKETAATKKAEPAKKEKPKKAEKKAPKKAPEPENAIFFATGNEKKLEEITQILGKKISLKSFKDLKEKPEVEETEDTLEGNAILKAKAYFEISGIPCFADDTGLEVYALDGNPGVKSARYAGEDGDAEKNMDKLMEELKGATDRSAKFRTVIAWYDGKDTKTFSGELKGEISIVKAGKNGFGYDPLFLPQNSDLTLAEMSADEKNKISHRAKALTKFVKFLK